MHNSSGGEKVTIVIHSMGGIVSLYFLNEVVTQEWKDQYINAWVTLSRAWSGGSIGVVCPHAQFTHAYFCYSKCCCQSCIVMLGSTTVLFMLMFK